MCRRENQLVDRQQGQQGMVGYWEFLQRQRESMERQALQSIQQAN
jgi:hypothetical protein